MVKCNHKMYDTISDFDFARIREGLIEDALKKFQRIMFGIREIFLENIERYTVKCSNFLNF